MYLNLFLQANSFKLANFVHFGLLRGKLAILERKRSGLPYLEKLNMIKNGVSESGTDSREGNKKWLKCEMKNLDGRESARKCENENEREGKKR